VASVTLAARAVQRIREDLAVAGVDSLTDGLEPGRRDRRDLTEWRFSILGGADWTQRVDAVATEGTKRLFWEVAVPQIATHAGPRPPTPCVVVCRVTVPRGRRQPLGGPLGRAKTLLDALHDDRKAGPYYSRLGAAAPLVNDDPARVCGLAVEVREGPPRTEYLIGRRLAIASQLLATVPVDAEAPNDVAGTKGEKRKIDAARITFGIAVRHAFAEHPGLAAVNLSALVVHHRSQRDEDNTWATWISAACGVRNPTRDSWYAGAPLTDMRPMSVASITKPNATHPVVYALYGERGD
jgi:hypothetical protein